MDVPAAAGEGKVNMAGQVVDSLPIALDGSRVFVAAPDSLQVIDGLTGESEGTFSPDGKPSNDASASLAVGSNPTGPSLLANIDGSQLVVTPFVVDVPGHGTTPGRRVVELLAVRADTVTEAWRAKVEVSGPTNDPPTVWASAVGARGADIILSLTDGQGAAIATVAVDARTRTVVWSKKNFQASFVSKNLVIGFSQDSIGLEHRAAALEAGTGRVAWKSKHSLYELTIMRAGGPSTAVVSGRDQDTGDSSLKLLDVKTGAVLQNAKGEFGGFACYYDRVATTVCSGVGGWNWAAAFDAHTRTWLWSLPDKKANRVAPTITAAWHGVAYGTSSEGPLTLDAVTGQDQQGTPEIAPNLVNHSIGVGLRDAQTLQVFRATG